MCEIANWITAVATVCGSLFVGFQLKTSKDIAQQEFENSMAKEYRTLVNRLPIKAMLGQELSEDEYQKAFDEFFHYIDLSNEQVFLRQQGNIGQEIWTNWREGIKFNITELPAFEKAWKEIKESLDKIDKNVFQELRWLEDHHFEGDPRMKGKSTTNTFLCQMMKKFILLWQWIRKSFVCASCLLLLTGEAHAKSPEEIIEETIMSISPSNADAQNSFGGMHYENKGVKEDAEAVNRYRLAAEQGEASAQYMLGSMYYYGDGVAQNYAEAIKWYRLAGGQGQELAQCCLGFMYEKGKGVKQDHAEAVKWYRIAAEQGEVTAQSNLGNMYSKGDGVQQDYAESVKWYRLAAAQGNASAQNNLGVCYADGQGVRQNYDEAIKWYRLAARQGEAIAQFNLGVIYENGRGVKQNKAIAKEWFGKACDNGDQDGCDAYRKLNIAPTKRR